jgi:CxxC-x17-CxxC domain-containing protein
VLLRHFAVWRPRPTYRALRQDDCSGSLHLVPLSRHLSRRSGDAAMEFVDRLLTCADCGGEFIFTAGEQLFFFDKQFKNDPKRCKPCKSKRAGASARPGGGPAAAGISRTETRTTCSDCGVETTVPFKPTQGRPVLCRQCFQNKRDCPIPLVASVDGLPSPMENVPIAPGMIPVATHAPRL